MHRIITVLFIVVSINSCFSQTLTGIVYDETNSPVPGALVFFDATTIGTLTNTEGEYSLSVKNKIKAALRVSVIGYEIHTIPNPFENLHQTIYLKPKTTNLNEVEIVADVLFTREQKIKIFREQFLGTSAAGKSCKIKNEDDIILSYNRNENRLYAYCDKPIIISNPYLGYEINFNLQKCYVEFKKTSIRSENIIKYSYIGSVLYTDVSNNNPEIITNREKTYQGSQLQFMRNLSNNVWNKKNFLLFKGSELVTDIDQYIQVTDTIELKQIIIKKNDLPPTKQKDNSTEETLPFSSTFGVRFNNKEISKIIFNTQTFYIDRYGNHTAYDLIEYRGVLGQERTGDLLPADY